MMAQKGQWPRKVNGPERSMARKRFSTGAGRSDRQTAEKFRRAIPQYLDADTKQQERR
jgi:hypothetical protein